MKGTGRPVSRSHVIHPAVRAEVIARAKRTCEYCDKVIPKKAWVSIDHIVPITLGGGHEIENLACACFPCNSSKGAKVGTRCECGHLMWVNFLGHVVGHGCKGERLRSGFVRECHLPKCHDGRHSFYRPSPRSYLDEDCA